MSAERGWIGEPSPTMEQQRQQWITHHREQGHQPYAARPNRENPERWECKCDPDAVWTAVWRILTPEQIRQKFAHLSKRPTATRSKGPVGSSTFGNDQQNGRQHGARLPAVPGRLP